MFSISKKFPIKFITKERPWKGLIIKEESFRDKINTSRSLELRVYLVYGT